MVAKQFEPFQQSKKECQIHIRSFGGPKHNEFENYVFLFKFPVVCHQVRSELRKINYTTVFGQRGGICCTHTHLPILQHARW
jgi:hypothetical protein